MLGRDKKLGIRVGLVGAQPFWWYVYCRTAGGGWVAMLRCVYSSLYGRAYVLFTSLYVLWYHSQVGVRYIIARVRHYAWFINFPLSLPLSLSLLFSFPYALRAVWGQVVKVREGTTKHTERDARVCDIISTNIFTILIRTSFKTLSITPRFTDIYPGKIWARIR